jgi:hypothetical protein
LQGHSIKAAFEAVHSLPFALETCYHVLQRLREGLPQVSCLLAREQKSRSSGQTDPL